MEIDSRLLARHIQQEVLIDDCYHIRKISRSGKPIKTFLDIGANFGWTSILVRFLYPHARILCVEPCVATCQGLSENVRNLRIEVVNVGLGVHGHIKLSQRGKTSGTTCSTPIEDARCPESYPLTALLERYRVDQQDLFIKLDCEGAEKYPLWDDHEIPFLFGARYVAAELHFKHPNLPNVPTKEEFIQRLSSLQESHKGLQFHIGRALGTMFYEQGEASC